MRVSDLITNDEIKKWKKGDIITIRAGTGAGKSHFIKTRLFLHAKNNNQKILMLVHRKNCLDQFQHEIQKDGRDKVIDLKTYQSIENYIQHQGRYDFDQYDYIVSDEFHYFMDDSAMNVYTDLSLDAILEHRNSIKIFMSATGDYMKEYINDKKELDTINYSLPIVYQSIKSITFFNKKDTYYMLINDFKDKNEKTIFFIDGELVFDLYKQNKDHSLFNCSKDNKYYKHVDKNKVQKMLENEKFDELFLFTTSVMDAGVNIKDLELVNIVVDVKDVNKLIQCIGRKRQLNRKDKINLYIRNLSKEQLGGYITTYNKRLEKANCLIWEGPEQYIKKHGRDPDYYRIVYDEVNEDLTVNKNINELMYFKIQKEIKSFRQMIRIGYIKYITELLGFKKYVVYEEKKKNNNLETYLNSIVGKKLFRNDQKELINKIDLRVNGRQQKSYRKLNEGLEMINMPFVILPKKSGNDRFWVVENISI